MTLSRCSKVFFLCLAALHFEADNFLSSQAEALALKPSTAKPARPKKSGKVVIQLDFSESDPPKTRVGHFKTKSLKAKAKKDLEVEFTLQPIHNNKVSRRKSVVVGPFKVFFLVLLRYCREKE